MTSLLFSPDQILVSSGAKHSVYHALQAIILNSPSNPTGVVYTKDELKAIGALDGVRDQVVTVNGMSKAYAMTGWRIGYMGGPADVVDAAAKVQSQVTGNANSIAQKAALAALSSPVPEVEVTRNELERRRNIALDILSSIRGVHLLRRKAQCMYSLT